MSETTEYPAENDWRALLDAGVAQAEDGATDEAKSHFLRALRASKQCGDPGAMLEALIQTGRALIGVGDDALARQTLQSGRKMAERLGDFGACERTDRSLRELDGETLDATLEAERARPVNNTKGETLPMTIGVYDQPRPAGAKTVRTLCHAPFVSVDFGPQGQVTVCNHYHKAMAQLDHERSFLEIWRGDEYRELRSRMQDYVIDEDLCRHCAKQIRAGDSRQTFAVQQYDPHPTTTPEPPFPRFLTFRLSNRCNLACVMCDGSLSSRIRREREGRPPQSSYYGERFFEEMKLVLPHVEHIEFFGGEPLLVDEHIRIFEILRQIESDCSIYINTNGTALNKQTRRYLEELNFTTIAVSMDSTIAELHAGIRIGVQQDVLLRNIDWLLELRARRPLHLLLNVTEQRGNWFDLPELFRFAADIECPLHINTCIHPSYCTLYTLPTDQLEFVHAYLERKQGELGEALDVAANADSYRHLLSLIESELSGRDADYQPPDDWLPKDPARAGTDGRLPAPIPGFAPFGTPDAMNRELGLMAAVDPQVLRGLYADIERHLAAMPRDEGWDRVRLPR